MGYWKAAPFKTGEKGHRREFYYDDRHRYRGEVEQFAENAPRAYGNVPGRRSGCMVSWEAAKQWVEARVPRVVK